MCRLRNLNSSEDEGVELGGKKYTVWEIKLLQGSESRPKWIMVVAVFGDGILPHCYEE